MAQLMLINPAARPKKRRAAAKRRARPAAKSNPAPRRRRGLRAVRTAAPRRRRVRRNPISTRGVMGDIMGAIQGAGGALAVNAAINLIPLPVNLKSGWGGTATKIGLAVALGMVAKPLVGRMAGKLAEGAMTVAAYEAIAGMVPSTFGGHAAAGVAGLGYMNPGMNAGGHYISNNSVMNGMGEYVSGLGEYVSGRGAYNTGFNG